MRLDVQTIEQTIDDITRNITHVGLWLNAVIGFVLVCHFVHNQTMRVDVDNWEYGFGIAFSSVFFFMVGTNILLGVLYFAMLISSDRDRTRPPPKIMAKPASRTSSPV